MTVYTTLNKIRAFDPCKSGWETLLSSLGKTTPDDEPLSLVYILESNGLRDALWCTRTIFYEHREKIVQYAIRCAENVLHIFEKAAPNETAPRLAIHAAKDYLKGKITKADLEVARADLAAVAAWAVEAAAWAAEAAARAALADWPGCAAEAAWAADRAALAARAARTDLAARAWWAAVATAVATALAAEKRFQENLFREIFGEVQP